MKSVNRFIPGLLIALFFCAGTHAQPARHVILISIDAMRPDNPHVLYAEARYRGYVRVEVTPKQLRADLRGLQSVQSRDASCSTIASFVVEDGTPGPKNSGPGS